MPLPAPMPAPMPVRLAALLLALWASAAAAQPQPAPAASAPPARPKAHVQVIEDDNVRIEESRFRGQAQRITVHNKVGPVRPYEIIVPAGGKDPSQDSGAAGQRAWSLFDF